MKQLIISAEKGLIKDMKKKTKTIIFLVPLCIVLLTVAMYFITNTSSLKEGIIYYSCSDNTFSNVYEYNIKTRTSKKVKVDGYDSIIAYYPLKGGYIAAVRNSEDDSKTPEAIIYNGEVLKKEYGIENMTVYGDYIFYIRTYDGFLVAINKETKEYTEISDKVKYGYAFQDNYLYYNERIAENPNQETAIIYVDCNSKILTKKTADSGIVCRNTDNQLIYLKGGKYFSYDFEAERPYQLESPELISDNYQKRYLGKLNVDEKSYTLYCNQKVIYSSDTYKDYYEYENELMRGVFLPTKQHYRIFSRLNIADDNGTLIIPVKNADRVHILAYENGGNVFYAEQPCTYCIY